MKMIRLWLPSTLLEPVNYLVRYSMTETEISVPSFRWRKCGLIDVAFVECSIRAIAFFITIRELRKYLAQIRE